MNAHHLIFVYGTLKRNERYHRLIRSSRFITTATTAPRYRLYDSGLYPCLVHDPAGVSVVGEIFRIEAAKLSLIDDLENVPFDFVRESIDLNDFPERVEAYFYQHEVSCYPECGTEWSSRSRKAYLSNLIEVAPLLPCPNSFRRPKK